MTDRDRDRVLLGAAAAAGVLLGARALVRKRNEYDFRGKTALITGGSRGLGLLLAGELARAGARVAICARDANELERAAAEVSRFGAPVYTEVCDLRIRAHVDAMVDSLIDRAGPIDVLINNAGVVQAGPVETMTLEDFREAMDIHFWAPLHVILAVLPYMRQRGGGRIANIASIGGLISVPHLVPYSASKFALVGLSRGLRAELRKDNITVTTVCPGLMRTGSPRQGYFKGQHRAEYAWFNISDSQPLTAINAERAARQIIDAIRHGEAELIITTQAKIAAKLDALFPEFSSGILEFANRLLPGPGGIGTQARRGSESESPASNNVFSAMGERAARKYNEVQPGAL
jgi:NAD(P)-dependent dehydrogenase (short-subunit alcohol dehydrogenase family)